MALGHDDTNNTNEAETFECCNDNGCPPLRWFTDLAKRLNISDADMVEVLQTAATWLTHHHFMAEFDTAAMEIPTSIEEVIELTMQGWRDGYIAAVDELRNASQEIVPIYVPDDPSELFEG